MVASARLVIGRGARLDKERSQLHWTLEERGCGI